MKNGQVVVKSGAGIIVRTGEGVKSFTQGDVDKRGVKIVRDGQPVELSELREGDRLSAVIITSLPPKVMTQREVNATLAAAKASGGGAPAAAAPAAAPARSASSTGSAASSRTTAPPSSTAPSGSSGSSTQSASAARTLPKTASSWPLVLLASALSLALGFALTLRRRLA